MSGESLIHWGYKLISCPKEKITMLDYIVNKVSKAIIIM